MAFFEDMFKSGNIATGLAIGVGAAVVGPLLTPLVGAVLRPAAKAVIKVGVLAYEAGREGAARVNEMSGDMVAEARSELDESRATRAKPASPGPREHSPA
ncbi:MAG TPA: DUF5132 domain-containing protein [Crenalkalicoccus sp.]|jgi:hypothetical protein|nr:DUF5132 domain-containing protein [Crenalkalicoccus sp.]